MLKKKLLMLALSSFILASCQSQDSQQAEANQESSQAQDSQTSVDQGSSESQDDQGTETDQPKEAGDKTIEEINQEEGIVAEQIVVKITDQGYVTTHGDHFHAYNGPVPADALISEGLVTGDEGVHVSDHEAGQVVKVAGEYKINLTESVTPYLRSEEEIASQAQGNDPGQTWPGAEYRNEQGKYTADDGYIFNPEDVTEDFGDAFLISLENVDHVIPKDRLTDFEIADAESALK